jgi:hypothetical protein
MFLYEDENNDKIIITKYTVEHDLEIDTYSLYLLNAEEEEVHYEEFMTYEYVKFYLSDLRANYLERFTN